MMKIAMEKHGGRRRVLDPGTGRGVLHPGNDDGRSGSCGRPPGIPVHNRAGFTRCHELCEKILKYLVIADAGQDQRFMGDAYIAQNKPKSLLCLPIHPPGKVIGFLYYRE
jgi:hypothetical protein